MKTIVKPGKPIYRDVLINGRFECRNCGCNFLVEKEDMEFENIYISGDILKIPYSSCPNCGETCGMLCGNYRRQLASEKNEIYLVLQGWRPCAYHGGRFLHRGEWEPDRWYEFMTRDGTVFKARMKEDAHMDCFYPKAKKKENEVWFYRECR